MTTSPSYTPSLPLDEYGEPSRHIILEKVKKKLERIVDGDSSDSDDVQIIDAIFHSLPKYIRQRKVASFPVIDKEADPDSSIEIRYQHKPRPSPSVARPPTSLQPTLLPVLRRTGRSRVPNVKFSEK